MLMRIATYFLWRALRPIALIGGVGWVIGSGLAAQDEAARVPVFIGGEAQLDACGSYGEVAVKPTPGNFLALRNQPNRNGTLISELANETGLMICSQTDDWLGVVVRQEGVDCGVSSPITVRQPYAGPCRSGWVHGDFVKLLAG